VFTEEHEAPAYGPERREKEDRRNEAEGVFKIKEITENDKRQAGRRLTDINISGNRSAQ
jgi:hypothetical protein